MIRFTRLQTFSSKLREQITSWLEMTETEQMRYPASILRAIVGLPKWVWLAGLILLVGSLFSFGKWGEVPGGIYIGSEISDAVDDAVDWVVANWDPMFRAINSFVLKYLLLPLERWLMALPWWLLVGVVALVSYKMVGKAFAVLSVVLMMALVLFGLFELSMTTLAIVLVSAGLAVAIGVPTGIAMAKNKVLEGVIRPVLDIMQTMPSFVYLIPVLMLFGLGMVPAVIAVVIYAVSPIIRLTNLGIKQVDSSVIEAAKAFGATRTQLLLNVELPLAIPTIMAGLNQTIMMALSMVVVASMIGARGLGVEVLNGIARLEVGRGLLGGIGIVIMAVILDRVTQGFARTRRRKKVA